MNEVHIGVIGVGRMGRNHCRVFSLLPKVELTGVHDLNSNVGAAVAHQYHAPHYDSVAALLPHVDAVSIATNTQSHFDLAVQCLAAGKHIFIEKPIAETVAQAEQLTQLAKRSKQIIQVGHIERFNPTYIELKRVMDTMTVLAINIRRLSPFAGSNTDVDVILDLMVHDLDLVLDIAGQTPTSMIAHGLTAYNGAIDHATVNLCFDDGPLVTVTASRLTEQKIRQIEVTSLQAYTEANLMDKSLSIHRSTIGEYMNHDLQGHQYRQESIVERIHVPMAEPLQLEMQHFVDSVLNGKQPQVTAVDGLEALQLVVQVQDDIKKNLLCVNKKGQVEGKELFAHQLDLTPTRG
ncbi:MAG: Gfo/Idh/MocA family oxidoreductase [Chloroflexi bacterium]|nr:Gfo/Idh/MocA family oxidoreductase [Chloroflexota bacterium]